MIGHLTSPKLDPLPADFEKSVLRFFIELGKQVRGLVVHYPGLLVHS